MICPICVQNYYFILITSNLNLFFFCYWDVIVLIKFNVFFFFFAERCVYFEFIGRNIRPCKVFLTLLIVFYENEWTKKTSLQLKTLNIKRQFIDLMLAKILALFIVISSYLLSIQTTLYAMLFTFNIILSVFFRYGKILIKSRWN